MDSHPQILVQSQSKSSLWLDLTFPTVCVFCRVWTVFAVNFSKVEYKGGGWPSLLLLRSVSLKKITQRYFSKGNAPSITEKLLVPRSFYKAKNTFVRSIQAIEEAGLLIKDMFVATATVCVLEPAVSAMEGPDERAINQLVFNQSEPL